MVSLRDRIHMLGDVIDGDDPLALQEFLEEAFPAEGDRNTMFKIRGSLQLDKYSAPDMMSLLEEFDPNMEVYGGHLLPCIAYHTAMNVGKTPDEIKLQRLFQRQVFGVFLTHGANPNYTFTPTTVDGGDAFNSFDLMILPEIGKPEIKINPLPKLLQLMCASGLDLGAAGRDLTKIQQLTDFLNPLDMLAKTGSSFDAAQVKSLYDVLINYGADLSRPFPDNGDSIIARIDHYRAVVNEAMHDPHVLRHAWSQHEQHAYAHEGYDLSQERLQQASAFYSELSAHLKDIYKSKSGWQPEVQQPSVYAWR